jgi:hypothetical protein
MDDTGRDPLVSELDAIVEALKEHPDLLRELLDTWPRPLTPAQRAALGALTARAQQACVDSPERDSPANCLKSLASEGNPKALPGFAAGFWPTPQLPRNAFLWRCR